MNRIIFVASAAAISLSSFTTPAFAAVDMTFGSHPALDAACNDLLPPSDQSGFTTYALGVTSNTSEETVDVGPEYIVPIGPSTTIVSGIYPKSEHLNGGSPNIFGNADKTVVYPGGAEKRRNTQTTKTTRESATGCHVHKPGAGASEVDHDNLHANFNAPPGLQKYVPASVVTSVEVINGYRVVEVIPGPYTDPTQSEIGAQVLICISPSTSTKRGAPGDWVGKNGYTGCSRALYDSLASKFDPNAPPTNSLPAT